LSLASNLKDRLFYGWVIVAAFFIISIALAGVRLSFGIFFKSIEAEFSLTRAATSTVLSTYMVLCTVFAILGGWALDKYGPRVITLLLGLFAGLSLLLISQVDSLWQLFVTYSLLFAAGSGAAFVVMMSTISRWFDKKRGLALGITSSGAGLGMVVMAPFATLLISSFGWQMAYGVIGLIILLVMIPLSRLLKRDPYEIGALPDGVKSGSGNEGVEQPKNEEGSTGSVGLSLLQALRARSFWLFVFINLFFASGVFLVMTHLVPHITDVGFSAGEAAAVFSLLGLTVIAGRVAMGIVSDRIGRKISFIICALLEAGAMVWLIYSQDLWMFYLFALVWGFAYGGVAPSAVALAGETFGLHRLGAIMGMLDVGFGIGAAIGPAMGGLIFDANSSYSVAFLIGAGGYFIAALLITLVRQETGRNFEGG